MADDGRADGAGEMANTAKATADAANETGERTEPRWGLFMPLLTAGVCPVKTARRTDHLSGFDSLITHVFAWLGLLGLLGGAITWNHGKIARLYGLMPWESEEMRFTITVAEVCFLLLALLLVPWGARHERIRTSVGRSFSRALRHTPHAMQAFLLACVVAAPFYWVRSEYQTALWQEVSATENELMSSGVPGHVAWQQAREIVQGRYPFHVIHGKKLGAAAYFAGGIWFLWGLLAAVGAAPPKTESEEHFPICEACGYNLTGLSMEGRCPECGEHVVNSLGPDARPGTPWQRSAVFGRWDGFWKTAGAALAGPTALGRRLISSPDETNHRSLMWFWCGGVFVLTWLGCLACHIAESNRGPVTWDAEFLWFVCPMASYFSALAALGFCVGSAGVVGLLSSWKHKRNMLPAAMQAACAAGGLFIVWLILAFSGWTIMAAAGAYPFMRRYAAAAPITLSILLAVGPSVACSLVYLWLIGRIARGARFANR